MASGFAESGGPLIASALPLRSEALMTQIATGRSQKRYSPIEPACGPETVLYAFLFFPPLQIPAST